MSIDLSMSALENFQQGHTIQGTLNDLGVLRRELEDRHPFHTAVLIGGLLTVPALQAASLRLESLVSMTVAVSRGPRIPKVKQIAPWYEALGRGQCKFLEDPPEDVFVGLVDGLNRTYRTFEGIWEGNAHITSMFMRVLSGMPDTRPYSDLKRQAHALLSLSDLVAQRAQLERYHEGSPDRPFSIPKSLHGQTDTLRSRVCFTRDDLKALGIDRADLDPFVFPMTSSPGLLSQSLGHTDLERSPLLEEGVILALVLPNAVGAAIRRLVIETIATGGMTNRLDFALAQAHAEAISSTMVLGGSSGMPAQFSRRGRFLMAESVLPVDDAHVIHFILVADDFQGFSNRGLTGFNSSQELSSRIAEAVTRCSADHVNNTGFRQGISMFVMCGWGRGFSFDIPVPAGGKWKVQALPAHDLITLSHMEDMKPQRLFAILRAEHELSLADVTFINPNGLLALTAWAQSLDGHLIPHERLHVDEHDKASHLLVHVDQDALRAARAEVARAWDRHRIQDVEGNEILVMRESPFSPPLGDGLAPLYASLDDVTEGRLRAVAKTQDRAWWLSIDTPHGTNRDIIYHLWLALSRWLERLVRKLEIWIPKAKTGAFEWNVVFDDMDLGHEEEEDPKYADLVALISIEPGQTKHGATIKCAQGFLDGIRSPENIAERALLRGLIESSFMRAGAELQEGRLEQLVDDVMPDSKARSMHGFRAQTFHDYLRDRLPKPILIDRYDDAASRINLGWLARRKEDGSIISGQTECVKFLDRLVDGIWGRMKLIISQLNKKQAIEFTLLNHEAAYADTQHWRRTFFAVRSLHNDGGAATRHVAENIARRSAADLACRILVEIINCESPETGELQLGKVDLCILMADVMLLHYMGGYRDAIRHEAMEATIKISPAGEVMMNHELSESVVARLGYSHQSASLEVDVARYRRMYRPHTVQTKDASSLEPEFLAAWLTEFGATFDQFRLFVDAIEDLGIQNHELVLSMRRSELIDSIAKSQTLNPETTGAILDRLTLETRPCWHQSPPGFLSNAWHPWRFGRQLSLLSRPIVALNTDPDPLIVLAPGIVRLALVYLFGGALEGTLDNKYFSTPVMRSWIGRSAERRGKEFNERVESRLRELGWKTRSNMKLDAILNMKLPADFGDVDVLAWRDDDPTVLCIECKHLNRDMTVGQIAERLAEYRGLDDANGKPDRLKKHLLRMDLLRQHNERLRKFVRAPSQITIQGALVFDDHTPMTFQRSEAMRDLLVCRIHDMEQELTHKLAPNPPRG